MSVMLGNKAVEEVVGLLNNGCLHRCGKIRAYYYERPPKVSGEYIAVNHLPFVHNGEACEGIVNVNIHVPKEIGDVPRAKRLNELANAVVSQFPPEGRYMGGAWFEFYADSRPTPDSDGTYYVNLQFKVIYNDLNY